MSDLSLKELSVVGEALFGPRWRSDVARSIGVTYRSVCRWYAEGSVPDGVRDRLRVVVRERLEGLEKARSVLWRKSHG